VFFSDIETI
jgi:isopenicillin N synthase-like dioxygenase